MNTTIEAASRPRRIAAAAASIALCGALGAVPIAASAAPAEQSTDVTIVQTQTSVGGAENGNVSKTVNIAAAGGTLDQTGAAVLSSAALFGAAAAAAGTAYAARRREEHGDA